MRRCVKYRLPLALSTPKTTAAERLSLHFMKQLAARGAENLRITGLKRRKHKDRIVMVQDLFCTLHCARDQFLVVSHDTSAITVEMQGRIDSVEKKLPSTLLRCNHEKWRL